MKPETEMMTNKKDLAEKGVEENPEMCKCPECGYEAEKSEFEGEQPEMEDGEEMTEEKEKPTPGKLALQIIMAKGKK